MTFQQAYVRTLHTPVVLGILSVAPKGHYFLQQKVLHNFPELFQKSVLDSRALAQPLITHLASRHRLGVSKNQLSQSFLKRRLQVLSIRTLPLIFALSHHQPHKPFDLHSLKTHTNILATSAFLKNQRSQSLFKAPLKGHWRVMLLKVRIEFLR